MRLPAKAFILILFIVVPSVLITYLGSQFIIKRSFENIEDQRSRLNVERVINALDAEIDAQDVLTGDWSSWDDAYEFAKDTNEDFIDANFGDATFENAGINLIAFYDTSGEPIHSRFFDLKEMKEVEIPEDIESELIIGKLLLGEEESLTKHGIISTLEGPLIITIHPILKSSGEGPSRGTLIMAKYLDKGIVDEISETTKLTVSLHKYDKDLFAGDQEILLKVQDSKTILGHGRIRDLYGNPAYTFKVEMDRNITQEGAKSILYFVYYLAIVGVLGMIAGNTFLRSVVINPISGLVRDLRKVAESGSFTGRVNVVSTDELGTLAGDINLTLDALAKTQGELSESQRTLSTLMSNLPGMAYRCLNDKEWTMKFVSRGAWSLTGHKPEEIMDNKAASYGSLVHPDDRKMVWDEVQKAVAQNRPFLIIYRIVTKDKETKWVWEQGREVEHPSGEKFLEGFINDITPQKTAEIELAKEKAGVEKTVEERTKELKTAREKISEGWLQIQQEKAKLVSSINSLALGFVITDGTGKILMTNPAVDKIFDESGKTWTFEDLQAELGSQYNLKVEIDLCLKDPTKCVPKTIEANSKFVRVMICPIIAPDAKEKEAFGVVVVFEDITAAKLLERSRDEFFSIASHELRTPLTAIRGNTSLIKEYYAKDIAKNPDLVEMVEDMHSSSVRLISIVSDFLDASRLELGKMEFKKENIDLGKISEEVVNTLAPIAKTKKLKVIFTKSKTSAVALGDEEKTRQIITNLVGNALNYTKAGSVNVGIAPGAGFVKVSVADTGVGISETNKALLFKKFQQAQEKTLTRDVTRGTGMGLYISKMLAKNMGGDVVLESSVEGKGSVFALTLPVAK